MHQSGYQYKQGVRQLEWKAAHIDLASSYDKQHNNKLTLRQKTQEPNRKIRKQRYNNLKLFGENNSFSNLYDLYSNCCAMN